MKKYILHSFCLFLVIYPAVGYGEMVLPVSKIIKEKRTYYEINGSTPIPVKKRDVDFLKKSGVILNYKMQKKLAGKKTLLELKQSLGILEDAPKGDIDVLKKEMLNKPKSLHVFILKRKPNQKKKHRRKKSKILKSLYFGRQYQ